MSIHQECVRRFQLQKEYLGTEKPVNKETPLVSVSVITYQHGKFIARCLDGILMQQTNFPVEVIVGEDGSDDGTREICIAYAEKHPDKIRLFLRDRKLSQYYNEKGEFVTRFNGRWNRMSIRGNYVAKCEGDDYWTDPFKLQKQVDFLESNPDFALSHHNMQVVYEDSGKPPHLSNPPEQPLITGILDLAEKNYIYTASVIYRMQNFKEIPEWRYLTPVGDYPNHLLHAQYGKIRYFPEVMGVYRVHSGGMWEHHSHEYRLEKWVTVLEHCRTAFSEEVNHKLTLQLLSTLKALILSSAVSGDKIKLFSQKILDLDPLFFSRMMTDNQTRINHLQNELNLLRKPKLFQLAWMISRPFSKRS